MKIALLATALLACAAACSSSVLPTDKPSMAVKVDAGHYIAGGIKVSLKSPVILPVAALETESVKGEEIVLPDKNPSLVVGPGVPKKVAGPIDTMTTLPRILDADSVKVYSGNTIYVKDKDYSIDPVWGAIWKLEHSSIPSDGKGSIGCSIPNGVKGSIGCSIPNGVKVSIDYTVNKTRIDLVQATKSGKVSIKKGAPAIVCPSAPAPDAGCVPMANIYLPYGTKAITNANIFPVSKESRTWKDFVSVSGADTLSQIRAKLRDGKPVTIVCWGDSVTQGYSASKKENGYVEQFRKLLQAAYPKTQITLINAGIAGTSTVGRLPAYDKEVLSYKPDLITAEFINDTLYEPEAIAKNYGTAVAQARAINPNVNFIIITPHMVVKEFQGHYEQMIPAIRKAAVDNKVAVADASNIWQHLPDAQIPFESLLANGINHPNDLGHRFFAECLMKLLAPTASSGDHCTCDGCK